MKYYKDLKKQLHKKGIDIINTDIYDNIEYWNEWYSGFVEGFHNYTIKLANGSVKRCEKLTMNMPKTVCEDRQKLIWSENVKITLDTEDKTKKLWEILNDKNNNFSIMFPRQLELAYAQGTTAFSEFKDKDGNVIIEYIGNALDIVPYKYNNYNVSGLAVLDRFVGEEKGKQIFYTHITYHDFENKTYTKLNELYKSKSADELGKEIAFSKMFPEVENPVIFEKIEVPHFQIFRPNVVNNFDIESPMGISILANSIDRFKAIDTKYDSFNQEFEDGRKKILVDRTALKGSPQVNEDGTVSNVSYFDGNDRTFVAVNGMENQPVKEIDFNLRYEEHIGGINSELLWLGANMGFGETQYSFDGSKVKTATEVLSEDSDAFRTKKNDELVLKSVIKDLVKAVCFLSGIESKEIKIETDYSRFKNETAEQQRYEREVNNGLISKVEYRMKVYGEDETTAQKMINKIKEEEPRIKDLIGE